MKIRLLISSPRLSDSQLQRLHSLGDFQMLEAEKLSAQEVINLVPDVEILTAGTSGIKTISKELLLGLKNLKYISTLTVGYDWVDIGAAKELGIPVSTIKGANSESVAEHTWGMILDLAKRITEFNRDLITKGEYRFGPYQGKEVFGKTIGVIGLGDIGTKVARIAHGFNMNIVGVNNSGKKIEGVKLVPLEELIKVSDVIAVCVPLTPKTYNMIDAEQVALMKQGVIVVNCSREEAINKKAIVEAVQSGKVFGYGIETEIMRPIAKEDAYFSNPRILVTPHNAFNTADAENKSFDTMIDNIEAYIEGRPQNLVEI